MYSYFCDIATGASEDCNLNEIPDDCEPNEDCNFNGIRDICDIGTGDSGDCNNNSVPDDCEIADGVVNNNQRTTEAPKQAT